LRVDVVELGGADQGVHRRGTLAATIGAGEQPRLAPEGNPAQRPLGRIVGQTDAAVIEEAGEGRPALQHVVHGLGGVGMARQPAALGAHPIRELANQRRDAVLACGTPVISCNPVDLALDREDRIDAAHSFRRQRCFAGIGNDKEVAPAVAPAGRLGDRSRSSPGIVEIAEAGIGVGLEDSVISGQMPGRMLAVAIARVIEDRRRRVRPAERAIVPNIGRPGR
jgi:hypothetical protein